MDICPFSGQIIFAPGTTDRLVGGAVYVFDYDTSTPAETYQDYAGSALHQYPIIIGSDGMIPPIFWREGPFRLRVETSASDNTPVLDLNGIKGEVLPTSGGGGGSSLTPDQYFTTGDVKLRFEDGPLTGFVRANNRSIGSASSGATERANNDCHDLYVYGWNKWADADAPVTGGRGANAESDWAANKPMTLLNSLGRALIGLDTMGNTAANVSQRSTTITTSNGSTTATVGSSAGLVRGMYIITANVPAGTIITDVNAGANTIVMSNPATLNFSGAAARFSFLRDSQAPGATGGAPSLILKEVELPLVTLQHNHATSFGNRQTALPAGAVHSVVLSNSTGSQETFTPQTSLTAPSFGAGQAHSLMQPAIAMTVYIRL